MNRLLLIVLRLIESLLLIFLFKIDFLNNINRNFFSFYGEVCFVINFWNRNFD